MSNDSDISMFLKELTEAWGFVIVASRPGFCEVSDPDGNVWQAPSLVGALRLASKQVDPLTTEMPKSKRGQGERKKAGDIL